MYCTTQYHKNVNTRISHLNSKIISLKPENFNKSATLNTGFTVISDISEASLAIFCNLLCTKYYGVPICWLCPAVLRPRAVQTIS